MRSRASLVLLIAVATRVLAQAADAPDIAQQYGPTANRLIEAALKDDAGYANLTYLCDRIGNRLSGSATLPLAIAWAAEQMKKAGLENVVTPPVSVPHWVRGTESGANVLIANGSPKCCSNSPPEEHAHLV